MVCIYCGSPTQVVNSRLQRRANNIWRRRKCLACGAIFTTEEHPNLHTGLVVRSGHNLAPFSRDHLFASILESCRHRPTSISDAAALTQTIIGELLGGQNNATVELADIVHIAHAVLARFDTAAATMYAAYHPKPQATATS